MDEKSVGKVFAGFSLALILLLILVKGSFDYQGAYLCELTGENQALMMDDCPAHNNPISWVVFGAFGISVLFLAFGIYLVFAKKGGGVKNGRVSGKGAREKEGQKPVKKIDASTLDSGEKKVYSALLESGGSAYQGNLLKETGFSKVKVSRILDKLEQKGVLERKRRGMANLVVLK